MSDETTLPTLKYLEAVMKLMAKNQISTLELPGLKLTKSVFKQPKMPLLNAKPKFNQPVNFKTDEDIMFASSSAPKLSLDQFERFAAVPVPVKDN